MTKIYIAFIFNLLLIWTACQSTTSSNSPTSQAAPVATWQRQPKRVLTSDSLKTSVDIYDFQGFKPFLTAPNSDTLYVINWWATWCRPCVEELPFFVALSQQYRNQAVRFLLVSLDFANQLESRLLPFIAQKKLPIEVIALESTGAGEWINAVDSTWSGAIPATLMYKGNRRQFFEQSFTQTSLDSVLQQFLK